MSDHPDIDRMVDHLFRHESGKMVSVLARILGIDQLDVAHDIVQDTLLKAMTVWRYGNIPDNPPAWLYTVARNKAIDFLRSQKSANRVDAIKADTVIAQAEFDEFFQEDEIQDSVLRMIFACCHPGIPDESQIALALKILCGLSVQEISRAFLTNEETIAKRIYRAKEKIQEDKIELEFPSVQTLPSRLAIVSHVLYLMFNEGYNSTHPNELIRKDVCAEAMRLCHLLTFHQTTNTPETNALLALMCFQASRLNSRISEQGQLITLRYQDRKTWNHGLIRKGMDYLDKATEQGAHSVYHLEAAIAGLHAASPSFEQTDWRGVFHLYESLYAMKPTPIVALNKAIASSYAINSQSALEQLQQITGLENHYLYHAALGEVSLSMEKKAEAKLHFEKAVTLTPSETEKKFLIEKLNALSGC